MSLDPNASRLQPRWETFVAPLAFLALGVALLSVFHVGFQASDDINYLVGALGWLDSFPYVGNSHWTLRHTITLPTAAFIQLFGMNGLAASLSNMLY